MNQDNIHDALNMLDDELIHEVSKLRDIRKKRKSMSPVRSFVFVF